MTLHGGRATVTGRKSPESLYDFGMATYDTGDTFDQSLAKGFVELWGLPPKMAGARDPPPQALRGTRADDPRCSPLAPDDAPQPRTVPSAAPALPSTLTMSAPVRWRSTTRTPLPRPSGTRDTGASHTSRLERPPRG